MFLARCWICVPAIFFCPPAYYLHCKLMGKLFLILIIYVEGFGTFVGIKLGIYI